MFFQIILFLPFPTYITVGIEVLLKSFIAKLILILVLAIIVAILLDGIIRQVNERIVTIFQGKFVATCPDVAFLVPETLDGLVHSDQ